MDKFKKSQILKLFFLLAFLIGTPLLSSSLRPTFLYFVLNVLIIALGVDAGLLSFISTTPQDHKKPLVDVQSKNDKQETPSDDNQTKQQFRLLERLSLEKIVGSIKVIDQTKQQLKLLEKLSLEKIVGSIKVINIMKKVHSIPSLFTIGAEETEEAEEFVEDDFQDSVGEISEQELYDKAETFIGNFYKQLKMQREKSWQNLHGVYQQSILSQ